MNAARDARLRARLERSRADARVDARLSEALSDHHGIGWHDLLLVDWLGSQTADGCTADAAAALGVAPSQLLRQALALEERGLVTRSGTAAGPRGWRLSRAGRHLLDDAGRTAGETLAAIG